MNVEKTNIENENIEISIPPKFYCYHHFTCSGKMCISKCSRQHGRELSHYIETNIHRPTKDSANNDLIDNQANSFVAHSIKSRFFASDGSLTKNKIWSVPGFQNTFPDQNDVQLVSAKKWGVKPVRNRTDAEKRKAELVYIGSNPFFHVDKLNNSIPYLVPRASILLQDIGRNFFDSLQCKGIPLHKIIVTSVLRTTDDVARLRQRNSNATENSCHLYATTFDICYNRYKTVEAPGEQRRAVRNDTLKWVFSEVLQDMREANRCWIKYEVKQGCFHITVR